MFTVCSFEDLREGVWGNVQVSPEEQRKRKREGPQISPGSSDEDVNDVYDVYSKDLPF